MHGSVALHIQPVQGGVLQEDVGGEIDSPLVPEHAQDTGLAFPVAQHLYAGALQADVQGQVVPPVTQGAEVDAHQGVSQGQLLVFAQCELAHPDPWRDSGPVGLYASEAHRGAHDTGGQVFDEFLVGFGVESKAEGQHLGGGADDDDKVQQPGDECSKTLEEAPEQLSAPGSAAYTSTTSYCSWV